MMAAGAVSWEADAIESCSDNELLAAARAGSNPAYGELWRRHTGAAMLVARRHRGRTSADDIVAAAATRVLGLLREGRGPEDNFRSYFLCTVRSVAVDCSRQEMREVPADDEQLEYALRPQSRPAADRDLGLDLDPELVHLAFTGLSESDQQLLWHTTVEGGAPRVVARRLGLSPNAVSVRAMRAREALRSRYLDSVAARWANRCDTEECRWVLEHLGGLVEGRLRAGQRRRVAAHVTTCPLSSRALDDLTSLHQQFGSFVGPLVLLAGLAAARLGEAGAAKVAATGASATGTAATGTAATGTAATGTAATGTAATGTAATGTAATGTAATGTAATGVTATASVATGTAATSAASAAGTGVAVASSGAATAAVTGGSAVTIATGAGATASVATAASVATGAASLLPAAVPAGIAAAAGPVGLALAAPAAVAAAMSTPVATAMAGLALGLGLAAATPMEGASAASIPAAVAQAVAADAPSPSAPAPSGTGQPACRSCHLLWLKRARTRG